jgi:hypothetical protein
MWNSWAAIKEEKQGGAPKQEMIFEESKSPFLTSSILETSEGIAEKISMEGRLIVKKQPMGNG